MFLCHISCPAQQEGVLGRGNTAPLILKLGTGWRLLVGLTCRSRNKSRNSLVPVEYEAGQDPQPARTHSRQDPQPARTHRRLYALQKQKKRKTYRAADGDRRTVPLILQFLAPALCEVTSRGTSFLSRNLRFCRCAVRIEIFSFFFDGGGSGGGRYVRMP